MKAFRIILLDHKETVQVEELKEKNDQEALWMVLEQLDLYLNLAVGWLNGLKLL